MNVTVSHRTEVFGIPKSCKRPRWLIATLDSDIDVAEPAAEQVERLYRYRLKPRDRWVEICRWKGRLYTSLASPIGDAIAADPRFPRPNGEPPYAEAVAGLRSVDQRQTDGGVAKSRKRLREIAADYAMIGGKAFRVTKDRHCWAISPSLGPAHRIALVEAGGVAAEPNYGKPSFGTCFPIDRLAEAKDVGHRLAATDRPLPVEGDVKVLGSGPFWDPRRDSLGDYRQKMCAEASKAANEALRSTSCLSREDQVALFAERICAMVAAFEEALAPSSHERMRLRGLISAI